MSRAPLVVLLGCALFVSACRTPVFAPSSLPGDDPRLAHLLSRLEEESQVRRSLTASAKLSLEAPDLKLSRPQRLAIQRPAALRIEILGLFGQVAAVLATDGAHYQFLDVSQARVVQGAMTPSLLWQYARVDLRPEQAVDLMLGVPRPLEGLVPHSAEGLEKDGLAVVLRGTPSDAWQRYEFDADGQLRRVATFDPVGDLVWEARYDAYRPVEGGSFPFELVLRFPRLEAETRVAYKSVLLNPDLPEETFVLNVPGRMRGSQR